MLSHRIKKNTINLLESFEKNINIILSKYNVTSNNEDQERNIRLKASEIILKLSEIEQVSFEHGTIAVCALLQSGAYLRSVTNRKIVSNGIEFTKKNLVFASEQVNNIYTFRAIAKSLKNIIALISLEYELPGHLYSQFKLEV